MAREAYYQKKIINWFISIGGTAITGTLPTGEADVQAGFPWVINERVHLLNVMVEVKTEEDYYRVMRALEEVNGLYVIVDQVPLKKHEALQITKLNNVRKKGGLAVLAFSVVQVRDYISGELDG